MSKKCRADFQQYFSDLMKVRNTDHQNQGVRSEEAQEKNGDETLWQNEFKGNLAKRNIIAFFYLNLIYYFIRSSMARASSLDIGTISSRAR